jgi:NAD(P)H dehydrogenase (quinone)
MMAKVAVVYHSGYGHTAVLAEKVAEGARDAGSEASVHVIEHGAQDFGPILDAVADADAIVFGSPTYMGDVSAAFKAFAEASSKVFGTGGWKDKLAGGFTVSNSAIGDKGHTLDSLQTLAGQHGMVWVSLGVPAPAVPFAERDEHTVNRLGGFSGLLSQADNASPEITPPAGDRETARLYGERVARAAIRWSRGDQAPAVSLAA